MKTHLSLARRSSFRHAFTLVELLVVIGIIAVLISILLPSLQRARQQANTVKCLSSLRQIGLGFQLYQQAHKGAMPVGRQDLPDFQGVIANGPHPSGANWYWQDFIMPYVSKTGKSGNAGGTAATVRSFEEARKSVMWGCPAWDGWPGQDAYTFSFGVSRFENGYSMNIWPTYTPSYPTSWSQNLPASELQMRWAGVYEGTHNKITKWTRPAERMLLVDANLWLLSFRDTPGPFSPQYAFRVANDLPGSSNVDRYRHGKYPGIIGSGNTATLAPNQGRVGYNILYVDGHAATAQSYADAHKAIRMRLPK